MKWQLAIVGGGPAGLALAIHAARHNLRAVVCERQAYPVDKACGEGLMPKGVHELERLGVSLPSAQLSPFHGIRYLQEDGTQVEAAFRSGPGWGVRRTTLVEALRRTALDAGAVIQPGVAVRRIQRHPTGVTLWTDQEAFEAELVVAADGLASPLRASQQLTVHGSRRPRRYGLRRHFRVSPWTEMVEVHFAAGVEAYVTPVGKEQIGVAFLFERSPESISFDALLGRVPVLEHRLRAAPAVSEARGAGPLWQNARTRVLDRFALLGDAAGYVDALTGEGLTLGLRGAGHLGAILPQVLASEASRHSLLPYQRAAQRDFRAYSTLTRALLLIARRPWLRRAAIHHLALHPRLFATPVSWVGSGSLRTALSRGS